MLPIALAVLVAAALAVLLVALFHLDRLIRTAYETHPNAWLAEGGPYFIGAPNRLNLLSHLAYMRVSFVWLFRTPPWVRSSPELLRRLRLVRQCVLAWNLAVIILAIGIGYFASM
jgi:hypothetical protein